MTLTPKGQRTETAFLDAARRTFAKKGYFKTKISDIAAAAGRSPGSFYNYYDSKEQLLAALLEDFSVEVMSESLKGQSRNPVEVVRAAVTAYWFSYQKYLPEIVGLFQISMTDDAFRDRWKENRAAGVRSVLEGLQSAEHAGYEVDLPLDVLASAVVSMLESCCWTWLVQGGDIGVETPDDEAAINTLSEIWLRTVYGRRNGAEAPAAPTVPR